MKDPNTKYGIVIDSGSSGSRLQIYQWTDPRSLSDSGDDSILRSVPQLIQQEDWSFKISPGISSFEDKPGKVWDDHYKHLVKYLEKIIPKDKQRQTPFFVLATAGMRLVPEEKRFKILNNICSSVNSHSRFFIPDCQNYVQVIDGETEGLYGWIGLNYLMRQFNNYDQQQQSSYGFMDMGGASTQIAFVPSSSEEILRHDDDLYKVTLRNVNGETQDWRVFVSTWLGFGANQARKRHLRNGITSLPSHKDTEKEVGQYFLDPCTPKDLVIDFDYHGNAYQAKGLGNYEHCLKDIYPLLLKHLPCEDEPCLFNGVHAPAIDFEKDKFVGISEYWYTANDIFNMGGEYSFLKFNEKVQEFCNSDWDSVLKNLHDGKYGKNMKEEYLRDSCFKASWVINVLHEGFGLPRIGLETDYLDEDKIDSINHENVHIPFTSANVIDGAELSWTLGKMVLYVSSQVEKEGQGDLKVGITSSENGLKLNHPRFIAGDPSRLLSLNSNLGGKDVYNKYELPSDRNKSEGSGGFLFLLVVFGALFMLLKLSKNKKYVHTKTLHRLSNSSLLQKIKLQLKTFYYNKIASQETCDIRESNLTLSSIEEGNNDDGSKYQGQLGNNGIRTRSSLLNFNQLHSAANSGRPPLKNSGSTSSVNSLLEFQKNYQAGTNSKKQSGAETPPKISVPKNNSILDFNKLRSSITSNGSQFDIRRNASTSKLQID